MEQKFTQLSKALQWLKGCAGMFNLLVMATALFSFTGSGGRLFKETPAKRINIVGKDRQLRMIISNKGVSPEVLAYGKEYTPSIPGGNSKSRLQVA